MSKKHDKEHRCPLCRKALFKAFVGFTKPRFVCDNGCDMGSNGYDGEPWFSRAQNTAGKTARDFVAFYWEKGNLLATGLEA